MNDDDIDTTTTAYLAGLAASAVFTAVVIYVFLRLLWWAALQGWPT